MTSLAAAVWILAWRASAAPMAAPAPAVDVSTAPPTVETVYTGDHLRDPFSKGSGISASVVDKPFSMDDFSIHNLALRGLMRDGKTEYALFGDSSSNATFILRNGKLYHEKGKMIPGISGSLSVKRKMARLINGEGDVQIFRLGEESKDD